MSDGTIDDHLKHSIDDQIIRLFRKVRMQKIENGDIINDEIRIGYGLKIIDDQIRLDLVDIDSRVKESLIYDPIQFDEYSSIEALEEGIHTHMIEAEVPVLYRLFKDPDSVPESNRHVMLSYVDNKRDGSVMLDPNGDVSLIRVPVVSNVLFMGSNYINGYIASLMKQQAVKEGLDIPNIGFTVNHEKTTLTAGSEIYSVEIKKDSNSRELSIQVPKHVSDDVRQNSIPILNRLYHELRDHIHYNQVS